MAAGPPFKLGVEPGLTAPGIAPAQTELRLELRPTAPGIAPAQAELRPLTEFGLAEPETS
jgi:hypothetical protein